MAASISTRTPWPSTPVSTGSVNNKLSLGAAYQGALGDTSQDHMMKASLSLKFQEPDTDTKKAGGKPSGLFRAEMRC